MKEVLYTLAMKCTRKDSGGRIDTLHAGHVWTTSDGKAKAIAMNWIVNRYPSHNGYFDYHVDIQATPYSR